MSADTPADGMKRKVYERELGKLQVELCQSGFAISRNG